MFEQETIDDESSELQRLAATRAALDPERRESRRDILINAAVEFLATKGDHTIDSLHHALCQIYQTKAITIPELEDALEQARAAGLVVMVLDLNEVDKWQATPGAKSESKQDQDWARRVLDDFDEDVRQQLDDLGHVLTAKQINDAPQLLYRSLAMGCKLSEQIPPIGFEFLRPIEFDGNAARSSLASVNSSTFRAAITELVGKAIDPDESFANEIVHMLVVSSVLLAFMNKRDLGQPIELGGFRLLLDTQVLVDLVNEGTSEQKVIKNLIELSVQLGMKVYIAEHSISEWQRLWNSADQDHPEKFEHQVLPRNTARLATGANPFINQYLIQKTRSHELTWHRFRADRSKVRPLLQQLGVVVRDNGNEDDDDRTRVTAIHSKMDALQRKSPRKRSRYGVGADAESAAMVSRWRRKYPTTPCSAYFVGADSLTGRAYKQVCPEDRVPLTVRPEAFLMYVACLTSDSARAKIEMADIVGSALVRDNFLGVATAYTLEEIMKLSSLLSENGNGLSLEDSREALQLDFLKLLDDEASPEERANAAAGEVMRRRSARRDARAKRLEAKSETVSKASQRKTQLAEDQLSAARELITSKELELQSQIDRNNTLRRIIGTIIVFAVLAASMTGLLLTGALSTWWTVVAVIVGVFYVVRSIQFCRDLRMKWHDIVYAACGEAAWMVLGVVLGKH